MSVLEGVLLGILQGLTEFLPVSSSGHLALAEHFAGVRGQGVTYEVFVHFGTALAVIWFFRRRVASIVVAAAGFLLRRRYDIEEARTALHLAIGTIPAALVGYFLEDHVARAFREPALVSVLLIVTGLVLWLTRSIGSEARPRETWRDALRIGAAQAAAILPGISRSGATISAGLLSGVARKSAAEFAFLLSIPVILGATAASFGEALAARAEIGAATAAGTVAAFVSALPAIWILLRVVSGGGLHRFAFYCWGIGALGLVLSLVGVGS
jgi:undecaprenyl-diphosphatase